MTAQEIHQISKLHWSIGDQLSEAIGLQNSVIDLNNHKPGFMQYLFPEGNPA
jgi:hypothetical protein